MTNGSARFEQTLMHLKRAEKTIPLGSQTYSKSRLTFPPGIAPIFSNRAEGCRIWDLDGHEYIDLVSALASVTLGYTDREITDAVIAQLSAGVTISLTHPIEAELAERIVDLVPCAEMVRFAKNGSDATSAAIRVARAATSRDHVVTCGYHGWHDWTIASLDSRNKGVPSAVKELVTAIGYNDLDALEKALSENDVAAVILEPMNVVFPETGYLEGVRELATRFGAVLIFDEMITGFRFAKGGAQELFGVTPDLATFGKGLANGYPLSAVTGRKDLMLHLEDVFFSGTFSGELLSMVAANVVMKRIQSSDVLARIQSFGEVLRDRVDLLIGEKNLRKVLSLSGHPSWIFVVWNADASSQIDALKILFMQEMCRNGVLMIASHNISAAHDAEALEVIVSAYDKTLDVISAAIDTDDVTAFLDAEVSSLGSSVR